MLQRHIDALRELREDPDVYGIPEQAAALDAAMASLEDAEKWRYAGMVCNNEGVLELKRRADVAEATISSLVVAAEAVLREYAQDRHSEYSDDVALEPESFPDWHALMRACRAARDRYFP